MTQITLVLIDGLRPDAVARAPMPVLLGLAAEGAFSLAARTVLPSTSLPSITSLFFSLPPQAHGMQDNIWNPLARPLPGLFEVFHAAGHSTLSLYNWAPLRDLAQPDSVDASLCLNNAEQPGAESGAGDWELVEAALPLLGRDFAFRFVYLGCTDTTGHRSGWMSTPYLAALASADRCLERLLAASPPGGTTVVLADHGGHEHSHGFDTLEDILIPLVFHGPNIPMGELAPGASILDVAPTLLGLAGLDAPPGWQGKRLF
jgi:predicted AlkP superfamily pyrophosphatase or phosphodiesterase